MSIKITYTRKEDDGHESLQISDFKDLQTFKDWLFEEDLFPKFSSNERYKLEPIEFEDYKGRTCKINIIEDDREIVFYTGTGVSHYVICTKEMANFLHTCDMQKNRYKKLLEKAIEKEAVAKEK